jgi:hypothetical protein
VVEWFRLQTIGGEDKFPVVHKGRGESYSLQVRLGAVEKGRLTASIQPGEERDFFLSSVWAFVMEWTLCLLLGSMRINV